MLRDFLIALSIANLWFLSVWKLFLIQHSTSYPYYHWKLNPAPLLLATMLDVLVLSGILFLLVTVARRLGKQSILGVIRASFTVAFVLLMVNLLLVAARNPPLGPLVSRLVDTPQLLLTWEGAMTIQSWFALLVLAGGCLGISMMIHSLLFRRQKLIKVSAVIALILSPFALFTFGQGMAQWIKYQSGEQFRELTAPATLQPNPGHRILWIVFDELDFRLTFLERPSTVVLPELDKFKSESIFAANSYPPGGDTETSLPALISGRLVSEITRTAPNELKLTFSDDNQSSSWSKYPNVFSRARDMGRNTGLAGWYHPYCRVIGSSLNRCSWETTSLLLLPNSEVPELITSPSKNMLGHVMLRVARSIFLPETARALFPRTPSEYRRYYLREFDAIHHEAIKMAGDANLNLVMVHYPVPHPPGIYDRRTNEFSSSATSGYLDNLALADWVVGQLRQTMIDRGVFENTTVLITSDHGLRADRVWRTHKIWQPVFTTEEPVVLNSLKDTRVPFLVKLAGESEAITYEPAFNTVLSHDLMLAILGGEISRTKEVAAWLDRHRSVVEY